jgi:hypothetical protein
MIKCAMCRCRCPFLLHHGEETWRGRDRERRSKLKKPRPNRIAIQKQIYSAWDNLKGVLKGSYEKSVWEHLAGTKNVPFKAREQSQIAFRVIDDRGKELMVEKKLGKEK